MTKKKPPKPKPVNTKSMESEVTYDSKRIVIFNSFEEENEYTAKERAGVSYEKRMEHIEMLRKWVFRKLLLPDGSWPTISKIFKVMPPYTNDVSK